MPESNGPAHERGLRAVLTTLYTSQVEGVRLLLVEDNPDDELLAIRAIKARHIHADVQVARDGEEAVRALGLQIGRADGVADVALPEAVVLDLKLPKLSGHEVLERLRAGATTSKLPVLVLSSSAEERDMDRALGMGASYLRKPDDFFEFINSVGEAIERLVQGVHLKPPTKSAES